MNAVIRYISRQAGRVALILLSLVPGLEIAMAQASYGLPERLSDKAEMSILVASPSDQDVYTLYGHAGFRVQDAEQGLDVTINYGIFDFSAGFILRFVKGETDYVVMPLPTDNYMQEYLTRGSSVTELVLNIPPSAMASAWESLLWDIRPEHCRYRYNFFYDNCSTRPLSIYEKAIASMTTRGSEPVSPLAADTTHAYQLYIQDADSLVSSWRSEINALEGRHPWLMLGTDLLLGVQTDERMTTRELAFLPHHLERLLSSAYYIERAYRASDGGGQEARDTQHPALRSVRRYTPQAPLPPAKTSWLGLVGPQVVFGLLALLACWSLWRAYRRGRYCRSYHYMMLAVAGLAGLLIFYVAVLSEHPHRWPNYNLVVLHPLHLLLAIPLMLSGRAWGRRLAYLYHFINFVVQCALLVSGLFGQAYFNSALYLISLTLGLLSLCYLVANKEARSAGADRG